jgi:adenosine deaminase
VEDNFRGIVETFGLEEADVARLARNSFVASFLDDSAKARHLAAIDAMTAAEA